MALLLEIFWSKVSHNYLANYMDMFDEFMNINW